MDRAPNAPLFKPGDHVRTPTFRLAVVTDIRTDGKRDLEYLDAEGGKVALEPSMLVLVKAAKVTPWPSRLPHSR